MVTPLPFALNDANFLKRLRIAVLADRVTIVDHAVKRMKQRKITQLQIRSCLLKGIIAEPASLTLRGDWKATLEYRHAGDFISVAVVIEVLSGGDYAVVVTVMNSGGGK